MHSLSTSVKLPKINILSRKKFLITEPDDQGFCKEQVEKINNEIYLQKQHMLKPWQKNSFSNIYTDSGNKTNHELLHSIQLTTKKSKKNINNEMIDYRRYYKDEQLNNIKDSLHISKQIKMISSVKKKVKEPLIDINTYINNTKKNCLQNMLLNLLQKERKKLENKENRYEKSLKHEIKSLDIDMKSFEIFTLHDTSKLSYNEKIINHLKMGNKYLTDIYKKLSQEYYVSKTEIRRLLKSICDLKTYVRFVNKLFFGDNKEITNDLNYLNFQALTDDEIDELTSDIMEELGDLIEVDDKKLLESNEILNDPKNLEMVFKMMENNILKILGEKEKYDKEFMDTIEIHNKEKNDLINKLNERENEYNDILNDLKIFKRNSANIFINYEAMDFSDYMKLLLIDIKNNVVDENEKESKKDIEEYNVNTEIINPIVNEIHQQEKQVDSLIKELTEYHQENKEIFNKAVIKIKNENKMIKFHLEIQKRDQKNREKSLKIMEKASRIPIIGRYKYNVQFPTVKVNKKKDNSQNKENDDYKLLDY